MFFVVSDDGDSSGTGPTGFTGAWQEAFLSNNNRTITTNSLDGNSAWRRYSSPHTGKRMWEALIFSSGVTPYNTSIGIIKQTEWDGLTNKYGGANLFGKAWNAAWYGNAGGTTIGKVVNGVSPGAPDAAYNQLSGEIWSVYVDYSALKMWVAKNGVVLAGDPVAGTGAMWTLPSADFDPIANIYINQLQGWTANFRSDHFVYPAVGYGPYPL